MYTERAVGRQTVSDLSRPVYAPRRCTCGRCGAPRLVAFTGKRQYLEIMNIGRVGKAKLKNVQLGRQTAFPQARRHLPFSLMFALTVTSGALASPQRLHSLCRLPKETYYGVAVRVTWMSYWACHLPQGWPLPAQTEVWVMTSTSGAAAMTTAARFAPYQALAERLKQVSWPDTRVASCSDGHRSEHM